MFGNIIRADWYRLLRTRFAKITAPVFALIVGFLWLFAEGEGVFTFGGPIGKTHDGVELTTGFVGFLYADPVHPHARELLNSATCMNILVLFAMTVTAIVVLSSDDTNGITKIAVAQGQSQTRLYLAKLVTLVLWTGGLWLLHNLLTLMIVMHYDGGGTGDAPWGAWAALISLQYGILLVFMLLTGFVQLVTGSRVVSSLTAVLLVFVTIIVENVMVGRDSWIGDAFLGINPVWHLDRVNRYWAESEILGHTLTYIGIAVPVLVVSSLLVLRRRELR